MSKIPKRRKAKNRKANGRFNGLDPDEHLTPSQACDYAAKRDVHINTNILALDRRDGKGPQYLRINGRWIRYTRRFLDPYIETRKPQVIDPAEQVKERR